MLAYITFIAAYLLCSCWQPSRRVCMIGMHWGTTFVHFAVLILVLGLIVTLITLYELLLTAQAQIETGLKGIVLSLLPSFPLSALGWYLKKKSQRRAGRSPDTPLQLMTEQQQPMLMFDNCSDEKLLPVNIMLAMGLFYSVYINSKLTLLADMEVKIGQSRPWICAM